MLHVEVHPHPSQRLRRRRLLATGLLGILGVAVGLFASMASRRDQLADREALLRVPGNEGWVVVGSFDERWPARIVATTDGLGDVHFEHRGTRRSYEKFDGYRLRVVHLLDREEQAVTVVLRSASPDSEEPRTARPERENVEQGVRR